MDSSYGEHTEGDQGAGLGGEKQVMGTKACARRDEHRAGAALPNHYIVPVKRVLRCVVTAI